jgi:phospholipase C
MGGHLAPNVYDHSSILKMIETVFGLPTLASINHQFDTQTPGQNNDAANGQPFGPPAPPRDASAALGNLIDVFNFAAAPTAAPDLPIVPAPRGVPADPAIAQRFAAALRN